MTENADAAAQEHDSGQARELSVRLTVPEMDCPSCAQKVDKSLQRVDGITDTTLQPTTGMATVSYDPDRAAEADVIAAIEGAGYEVIGGEDGSDGESVDGMEIAPPSEIWTSSRAIKTWIGAGFVVLGLLFEFVLAGQNPEIATLLSHSFTVADGLFLVAIAVSGYPVVRGGYYSARNLSLDIELLMGTAIIAATGIGYFVEAATLAVLFSVAELLEDYAMDRARNSLRELMELSPDEAAVRRDDEEVTVSVEEVEIGETVVVRPGEKIPLDGTVIEGGSAVDQSPITGESVPVDKAEGDDVYAGSINEEGYLEVKVTSTAGDSTLSQIIGMVQGAQEKKTEKEQFVDRFSGYYTPAVVVLAILTAAVPPLVLGWPWQTWFIRGLTLLVIACPCAFVISTPVSVVSGITSAAKNGVLIKGGNHLEAMGEVDAVALDKTGTLTKGELTVTDIVPLGDHSESDVLRYGAGLEQRSEHPIAEAILTRADEGDVTDLPAPSDFESLTGKGIRATIDGETYFVGKPALFEELGFDLPQARRTTDGGTVSEEVTADSGLEEQEKEYTDHVLAGLEEEGRTVVLVGTETELVGGIAIADEVRSTSRRAVERLHELGVGRVVMLTGDNEGTAHAIAEQVGVDEYRAELLPEQKIEALDKLRDEYGDVAMVGDGVNDAPALATATVGVAMGAAGTDTALETADIALMGDDLSKLPYLYDLSHKAGNVIQQNIWASLGVKALLAIGVPLGYVSVAVAVVVGDMGMSLGVTGNAMRLSRIVPDSLHNDADREAEV
ncbi:heavy metal translocating P-type ATPase [Halococcus saccharolyticus]|uniref:Cation-transporting ATPase n=1 Tax=Halococcus saccharolyticus DSM 5350 TaxID=1227455 RepID=M0MNQ3_9EURY|nr:cation-translocating P-type ATPase [Halococcus saccharolyticus]EMA46055.1 cation-transporting ATPase [Halococcus saccharolyticus DSM 5350]